MSHLRELSAIRDLPGRTAWRLRRSPRLYWSVIAIGLALVITGWRSADHRLAARAAMWGAAHDVMVARHLIAAGEPITADDVAMQRRPVAISPPDSLDQLPSMARARDRLGPGDVLTFTHVVTAGSAVDAQLGPGERAIALGRTPLPSGIVAGDRVELFGTSPGPLGSQATTLCQGRLLAVTDEVVTIAVPAAAVADVAAASMDGSVVVTAAA